MCMQSTSEILIFVSVEFWHLQLGDVDENMTVMTTYQMHMYTLWRSGKDLTSRSQVQHPEGSVDNFFW